MIERRDEYGVPLVGARDFCEKYFSDYSQNREFFSMKIHPHIHTLITLADFKNEHFNVRIQLTYLFLLFGIVIVLHTIQGHM